VQSGIAVAINIYQSLSKGCGRMKDDVEKILHEGLAAHSATCSLDHSGQLDIQQVSADILRVRWRGAPRSASVTSVNGPGLLAELGHTLSTCGEILSERGWEYSTGRDDGEPYIELSRLLMPLSEDP
jgi:hypothetical protein